MVTRAVVSGKDLIACNVANRIASIKDLISKLGTKRWLNRSKFIIEYDVTHVPWKELVSFIWYWKSQHNWSLPHHSSYYTLRCSSTRKEHLGGGGGSYSASTWVRERSHAEFHMVPHMYGNGASAIHPWAGAHVPSFEKMLLARMNLLGVCVCACRLPYMIDHHCWNDGASPVCWCMWFVRCSLRVNVFGQYVQRCGDSPVCWRTWFNRCSLRVNVFEQKSHRCGVSPACRAKRYWEFIPEQRAN